MTTLDVSLKEAHAASRHLRKLYGGMTPLFPITSLVNNGLTLNIYGKFENVNFMSTFKSRGAEWFMYQLHNEDKDSRVKPIPVTASAGNHALGTAKSAQRYGLECIVFMPVGTPPIKKDPVYKLGATVHLVGKTFDTTLETALDFVKTDPRYVFVPPYQHERIIAGQASVGIELLHQMQQRHRLPDYILCGLGGGGLASGIGVVLDEFNAGQGTQIQVIGVQTAAADPMYRSMKAGKIVDIPDKTLSTLAEGIAVRNTYQTMFDTVNRYVDQVVVVDESAIEQCIEYLGRHDKLCALSWKTDTHRPMNIVEGAGAAPFAAAFLGDKYDELPWLAHPKTHMKETNEVNICCVLSGANIDRAKFDQIIGVRKSFLDLFKLDT